MDIIQAIILGIVQGLTEFLPISSTAHLRVLPALLHWPDPGAAFTAAIQLGTLLAVLAYFRSDLWKALSGWAKSFRGGEHAKSQDARMGWCIFIGTIPIVVFGILFKHQIEVSLRSLTVVAWSLIGMGLLLAIAEKFTPKNRGIEATGIKDSIWIGLWQAVALIPGASRSGSTITGGMFAGLSREAAARFSFLLSVPSILGAAILSIKEHKETLLHADLVPMLVANLFSFGVGYASIALLMKFLQTHRSYGFTIYRVLLGITILVLLSYGTVTPMEGIH